MNPHTKDFRHHALNGEKTGSPFQADTTFRSKRLPPGFAVLILLIVSPFIWAALIWGGMAVIRSW